MHINSTTKPTEWGFTVGSTHNWWADELTLIAWTSNIKFHLHVELLEQIVIFLLRMQYGEGRVDQTAVDADMYTRI